MTYYEKQINQSNDNKTIFFVGLSLNFNQLHSKKQESAYFSKKKAARISIRTA
jgi:hypothetical protein